MRPPLLSIFRSHHQARMLATLLLHPGQEHTVADLAQHVGVSASTLHLEVERLVAAGILRDRRVGRTRLLSANPDNRLAGPLTELLTLTYGPLTAVADEFGMLDDVDVVLLYGSWAARYSGEPGPPPNDVDVLVVGAPARTAVYDAAERAGRRLGLPVNVTISSRQRWEAVADALVQQIRASPSVVVVDRHGIDRGGGP
jgi:DNA-binding transcriptional ArsR family regulator